MQRIARLLCAMLLLCGGGRAWAAPEAFELQAPLTFFARDVSIPTTNVLAGTFGSVLNGGATISPTDYASLPNVVFDLESEDTAAAYTFSCNGWTATVDLATMVQARASHTIWLDFSPPAGQENLTLDLMVAEERAPHSLALLQMVNGTRVITPLSVGEKVWFNSSVAGYRATVPYDSALPFQVVDGTAGERTPTGRIVLAGAWEEGTNDDFFRSVIFYLDGLQLGSHYTLHYQAFECPEVFRSLVATPGPQGMQQLGDGTSEDETGAVCVTGLVPAWTSYWVSRDMDGAASEGHWLDRNTAAVGPAQWSLRGEHSLPPPMETIVLHVAVSNEAALSVHQASAERAVTCPDETVYMVEDYDEWGNPHHFYYRNFTASVLMGETWWLNAGNSQGNANDPWLTEGWSALNGTPPDRQAQMFGIAAGFGAHAWVADASGACPLTLALGGQRTEDYNGDGTPHHFDYDLWTATVDISRPYFLTIGNSAGSVLAHMDANEQWFRNGWEPAGGIPINHQQVTFTIPHGEHQVWLWEGNAWKALTVFVRGHREDYFKDEAGTPNFFEYDAYTTIVDVNRPYHLLVDDRALEDYQITDYGDWVWQGGTKHQFTLTVTLHGSRAGHDFTIQEPDGTLWDWTPSGTLAEWELYLPNAWDFDGTQPFWGFNTDVLSTTWSHLYSGQVGLWTLTDATTGQSQTFDPGTAAAYTLNLAAWFTSATAFPITVSLSRWSHDLRIMDRAGGNYSVDRIASQGTCTFGNDGTWYDSYYYFDATAHRVLVPGVEWRVYDATTGEYAPFDPSDSANYTNWHYTPAPAHVTGTQTALNTLEITWDFPTPPGGSPAGDSAELLAGSFTVQRLDPVNQAWVVLKSDLASSFPQSTPANSPVFHYVQSPIAPGTYSYRLIYSYGGQESAIVERTFTVLPLITYYGIAPFNLAAPQTGLDAINLAWTLPAVPGIDTTQGFFTIVRTARRGGAPVTIIKQASDTFVATDGTLSGLLWDSPLLEDDYTYTVSYTYGGAQGPSTSVTGRVLDAATLDTIDVVPAPWPFGISMRKLDYFLYMMGYWPLGMDGPDFMVVKPGESRTFNVWATGSVGPVTIALSPQQNNDFGTVTAEQTSARSMRVTYTAHDTHENKTQGGVESIGFVVSDSCRSHLHSATIEIVPNQSPVLRALNHEIGMGAGLQSVSGLLPAVGGTAPFTFEVFEPTNGSVTLDDPSTGEFTYNGPGNAFFNFTVYDADYDGVSVPPGATVFVRAAPGTPGGGNSDPEPNRDIPTDHVTIDVSAMQGVVGDEIKSTKIAGTRHFVSPKQTTALNQPNVVLTAKMFDAGGQSFDEMYHWHIDNIPFEFHGSTFNVPRSATGQFGVSIRENGSNDVMDRIVVWIIWANASPAVVGTTDSGSKVYDWTYAVEPATNTRWRFKFVIEPTAIIEKRDANGQVDPTFDRPNLRGPKTAGVALPGKGKPFFGNDAYTNTVNNGDGDTAFAKWDVSRKIEVKVRNPGMIPAATFAATPVGNGRLPLVLTQGQPRLDDNIPIVSFRSDDAEGNDDPFFKPPIVDEDGNPYVAKMLDVTEPDSGALLHAVGGLSSCDAPSHSAKGPWGAGLPDGTAFEIEDRFREFARVELCAPGRVKNDGKRYWFRVSKFQDWHFSFRAKWDSNPITGGWKDGNLKSETKFDGEND